MSYNKIHFEVYNHIPKLNCFLDYVFEDKSKYTKANTKFKDPDDDFLIGDSTGILLNWDFVFVNTEVFSRTALFFEQHGKYTLAKKGSLEYKDFWKKEINRRRKGMTILGKLRRDLIPAYNACTTDDERRALCQPLHISGDHYHYLNYSRILRLMNDEEKANAAKRGEVKQKKIQGFPVFMDGDYWTFKVDEFVTINDYNLCKGKSRRKGYSYKKGSQGANTVNLNPNVTVLLAAGNDKYLTDPGATSDMIKTNLDWLENHTNWKRGYLSEDLKGIELGYKKSTTGNKKFGWRSKVISATCNGNTSALVGKDAIEITIEEAGVFPNLLETNNVTMSATEAGDEKVARMDWYGTGGTKGANWADFKYIMYNPNAYGALPLENVWDINARHTTCGYFHPQILCYQPHMDTYGNSYLTLSYLIDEQKKKDAEKSLPIDAYIVFCSQRANSPSEAFNATGENIFSSPELNNHVKYVTSIDSTIARREGDFINSDSKVIFKTNTQLKEDGTETHPFVVNVPFKTGDDIRGCWRIYHEPIKVNGSIPDDLYYVLVDPIGKDKTIKEITTKNSLSSIYVFAYPNLLGVPADIPLAIYVGRDEELESSSRRSRDAAMYYNAKVCPETDRGNVVADFKRWSITHRLIKNPMASINEKINVQGPSDYGINIGGGGRAVEAIINLKNLLYTPINTTEEGVKYLFQYIYDLPTLVELQTFNSTGNFDRISAYRLITFVRLAYITKQMKPNVRAGGKTALGSIRLYQN